MIEENVIKELEKMSQAVNYNRWIFKGVKKFLGKRILEVGGGIGNLTEFLTHKELVVIIEPSMDSLNILKNKFSELPNIKILRDDICSSSLIDLIKPQSIDTVLCLNVLEHIENDLKALKSIHRCLQNEGRLVLLVPAFKWAYGTLDKINGHFRRYDKKELEKKLLECEFLIKKSFYLNSLGLFTWFFSGRILKQEGVPVWPLLFYDRFIIPVLSAIEKIFPPPFGQSLVFVAQKPREDN